MIARKSALIIAVQLTNGLLGYIGLKFIALYMEPWEYGIVGFAYGFAALFSIFGRLGFDEAHIKRVSEGKNLDRCIATFAVIKLFLSGIMASILIASIAIWKYVIGRGFETPLHEQAIYIMLTYFVLATLAHSMIATFNARKETAKAQLPLLLYNIVRITATIFVALFGLGPLALAYTYLIGEIFHFTLAFLFFREYPCGKPSFLYFKNYLSFAAPMAVAAASHTIMTNIDKIFIQLFWSATQVGEYFAIFNLSRFIILFASAVGILLLPTISEYHTKNNMKEIKKLTLQSERYLSMIVFPIITLAIVLAEPIIRILLSSKYMPALPVLQILPLFVLIEVLSRPYQSQLQGIDRPEITRNKVVIMMIANIFLNLMLIPKDIRTLNLKLLGLGVTGAAIATVISYTIGFLYLRISAFRITGIKGNPKVLLHCLSAALMGLTVDYLIQHIFTVTRWYHLLTISILGMLIYLAFLFLLREFRKKDFNFFIDTLNIKKMIQYIREEIKIK